MSKSNDLRNAAAVMGRKGGRMLAQKSTPEERSERARLAGSSKKLLCVCGACKICKAREYQRAWRRRHKKLKG